MLVKDLRKEGGGWKGPRPNTVVFPPRLAGHTGAEAGVQQTAQPLTPETTSFLENHLGMILWTLSVRASQAWKKIHWWRKEGNLAGLLHQDAERTMDRIMWPKTAIQSAGSNVSTVWDHTPKRQKQRWEIRQTRKGLLIPTIRNLDYFWTRQNSHAEKSFSLIFLGEPYLRHQWLTSCNPSVKKKKIFKKFGHTAQHIGSYIPDQGSNLCPLHWKHEILTTRPSGKSQIPEILCCKDSQPYIHLNNCNRDN